MRFWEALRELENGKSIIREDYEKDPFHSLEDLAKFMSNMRSPEILGDFTSIWQLYEEPQKLLSFPEVLEGLKKGKKFKRKDWDGWINEKSFPPFMLYLSDIQATDWIEVL